MCNLYAPEPWQLAFFEVPPVPIIRDPFGPMTLMKPVVEPVAHVVEPVAHVEPAVEPLKSVEPTSQCVSQIAAENVSSSVGDRKVDFCKKLLPVGNENKNENAVKESAVIVQQASLFKWPVILRRGASTSRPPVKSKFKTEELKIKSDLGSAERYKFICDKSTTSLQNIYVDIRNAKNIPVPITESGEFIVSLRRDRYNVHKKRHVDGRERGCERQRRDRPRYIYMSTFDDLHRVEVWEHKDDKEYDLNRNASFAWVTKQNMFRINLDCLEPEEHNMNMPRVELRLHFLHQTAPISINVIASWSQSNRPSKRKVPNLELIYEESDID